MKLTKKEDHRIRNSLTIADGNLDYMCITKEFDSDSCKAAKVGMQRILKLLDEAIICD